MLYFFIINIAYKVKFITMDLYNPYYILMHKLIPNAILISDRFHIVLQIRNTLDKTRINLCKKSNPNYNKLKKYWKLILKNEDDLDKSLASLNSFRQAIVSRADDISINPMKYVDKVMISYPNPIHSFANPYMTSIYTGMMFNGYI